MNFIKNLFSKEEAEDYNQSGVVHTPHDFNRTGTRSDGVNVNDFVEEEYEPEKKFNKKLVAAIAGTCLVALVVTLSVTLSHKSSSSSSANAALSDSGNNGGSGLWKCRADNSSAWGTCGDCGAATRQVQCCDPSSTDGNCNSVNLAQCNMGSIPSTCQSGFSWFCSLSNNNATVAVFTADACSASNPCSAGVVKTALCCSNGVACVSTNSADPSSCPSTKPASCDSAPTTVASIFSPTNPSNSTNQTVNGTSSPNETTTVVPTTITPTTVVPTPKPTPAPTPAPTPTHDLQCVSWFPIHSSNFPGNMEGAVHGDLGQIAQYFSCVKSYAAEYGGVSVADAAAAHELTAIIGVQYQSEVDIQAGIAACSKDNVIAIILGSEDAASPDARGQILAVAARMKSAGCSKAIGTSQKIGDYMNGGPALGLQSLDFLGITVYPFFSQGTDVNNPIDMMLKQLNILYGQQPGLVNKFHITESGWPTGGSNFYGNQPSTATAALYIKQFSDLACNNQFKKWASYYVFYDEKTGQNPDVNQWFGLATADGNVKFDIPVCR